MSGRSTPNEWLVGRGGKKGRGGGGALGGAVVGGGAGAKPGRLEAAFNKGAGATPTRLGAAFGNRGNAARAGGTAALVLGAVNIGEAVLSGDFDRDSLVEDIGGVIGSALGAAGGAAAGSVVPVAGTLAGGIAGGVAGDALGRQIARGALGVFDRFESGGAGGLDEETAQAYRTRNFASLGVVSPVKDLAPAPVSGVSPGVKTRGNMRYQSRVSIGTINVSSNASDPKQVAAEVADEIERRQREQRERVDNDVTSDGSPEIVF